jgi:predicted phosphodiesterase
VVAGRVADPGAPRDALSADVGSPRRGGLAASALAVKPSSALVHVALLGACAAASLAGGFLVVQAFASSVEPFTLGTVDVEVEPAREGAADVYVPIVDWGVRAEPFDAPLELKLRFQSLDRDAARRALRSGTEAEASLIRLRSDIAALGERALVRAGLLALAGGIGGGFLAGGLIGAARRQRRWMGYGAFAGAAVSLAVVALSLFQVARIDYDAFQRPTFYAHGRELPRLLSLSEQIFTTGENYTESYEQALAGLANLVAFAGRPEGVPEETQGALVASDLHLNSLVLPILEDHGRGKPLFFVGDFTLLGTRYERVLANRVARLGDPVVAVSGNHDSAPFMRALAAGGAVVLTRGGRLRADGSSDGDAVTEVAGLAVAGYDDPLEGRGETIEGRQLELRGEDLDREADAFVAWFESLDERPDVVLVHQHGLAHALLEAQPETPRPELIVLTGHDHEQHVERRGSALLVDGGTVGAGGAFAIGEQPVGFVELQLSEDGLTALDLIEVEPLSGEGRAERLVP